jgi:hypothetical protein
MWSYNSDATDTTVQWQIPSVTEGTHSVFMKVTDDCGNSSIDTCSVSWTFKYDVTPPSSPEAFTIEPGHQVCALSWQNPTGDPSFKGVEIRRNRWANGAYPEYDDEFPVPDGYPLTHTSGWFVYRGPAQVHIDDLSSWSRNVFFYSIFAYDSAGNYSALAPGDTLTAPSYWLGDVNSDAEINQADLDILSSTFGTTDGDTEYNNEFDIGPTYSTNPRGVPSTDNQIDFEDLILFAINYGMDIPSATTGWPGFNEGVYGRPRMPSDPDDASLTLIPGSQVDVTGDIDTIWVNLDGGFIGVEGAFLNISYDKDYVTPTEVIAGPDLPTSAFLDYEIFSEDSIVINLGILDGVLDGPGSILGIVLTADFVTDQTALDFAQATVRDSWNQDFAFSTTGATIEIMDYQCGNVNASIDVDIDDVVYLISYIFTGGPAPVPYISGDVNCSGYVDIDDVVYLINYIFGGGPAPCDTDGDGIPDC